MERQLQSRVRLDHEMLRKVSGYYIYRSDEEEDGRPIIDGVYIQRGAVDGNPPETMSLLLEWE